MKFKDLFGLKGKEGGVKGNRVSTRLDTAFVSMSGCKMRFIFLSFFKPELLNFLP